MTAAVVGLGLMGGSYAKGLTRAGVRVIGINRTRAAEEEALRDGAVAAAGLAHLGEAQLVIFCTPEGATEAFIREHRGDFRRGAVLTDIAGVKRGGAGRIEAVLPVDIDFVSAHPMAGREGAGYGQSSPDVFAGSNYILVPSARNRRSSLALVRQLAEVLGAAHIEAVTPEEHDRIMAYTSGLPHARRGGHGERVLPAGDASFHRRWLPGRDAHRRYQRGAVDGAVSGEPGEYAPRAGAL